MLKYNLKRIFRLRGINNPMSFLVKNGMSNGVAWGLLKSEPTSIKLARLEWLCKLLNCTPDDFMEWIPDNKAEDRQDHPLAYLRKDDINFDINKILRNMSLDQIKEMSIKQINNEG